MSLILDALRKSEAERRKVRAASDALAEVPRASASALGGVPAWVWPAVALVAVALTAWLWLGRPAETGALPPAPPADGSAAEGTTGDPTMSGADAPDAALGLATAAIGDAPRPAAPKAPPSAMAPDSAPSAPATTLHAPATAASSSPPPSVAPMPTAAILPAGATAAPMPVAPSATVRTSPSPVPVPVPAPAPVPNRAPSESSETAAVPSRAPAAPASPSPHPASSPLRLSDLSTADRQQLPPLKMSLHMWGAEAGKRFAIIDGNRVGEGDRVGDAVVAAIDQDGVVLAWNGIRLRVPVR